MNLFNILNVFVMNEVRILQNLILLLKITRGLCIIYSYFGRRESHKMSKSHLPSIIPPCPNNSQSVHLCICLTLEKQWLVSIWPRLSSVFYFTFFSNFKTFDQVDLLIWSDHVSLLLSLALRPLSYLGLSFGLCTI